LYFVKVSNQVGTFGTLTYHFPVLEISIYFVALFFILAAYPFSLYDIAKDIL